MQKFCHFATKIIDKWPKKETPGVAAPSVPVTNHRMKWSDLRKIIIPFHSLKYKKGMIFYGRRNQKTRKNMVILF